MRQAEINALREMVFQAWRPRERQPLGRPRGKAAAVARLGAFETAVGGLVEVWPGAIDDAPAYCEVAVHGHAVPGPPIDAAMAIRTIDGTVRILEEAPWTGREASGRDAYEEGAQAAQDLAAWARWQLEHLTPAPRGQE